MRDHMPQHVAKLIEVYRGKRDAMLQGLWEVLEGTDVEISKPAGGFFIWIKLPTAADTQKLAAAAREAGVGYVPGNAFMPNGGGGALHPPRVQLRVGGELPRRCAAPRLGHPHRDGLSAHGGAGRGYGTVPPPRAVSRRNVSPIFDVLLTNTFLDRPARGFLEHYSLAARAIVERCIRGNRSLLGKVCGWPLSLLAGCVQPL
jgi:hypothetical protein